MEQRSEETYEIVRGNRVAVTAAIATYNEEAHIGRCLMDLLAQQDVGGEIEILVIDGMSTDRTADIVRSFPEYGTKIRLIPNRRRLQVHAWNIALREMHGEYFAMITAHAEYDPRYFAGCLDTLRRTGAVAVGGVPRAHAGGVVGRGIAWCMSTPFGVGNARFRYLSRDEETDTVPLIFTRRESIEAIGGWDEHIAFDEDSDLSYRLRARGGKLVVSPRIGVRYYVRESLKALSKQMYRYGYWRRYTQMKHPGTVPARVLAPPVLLAGLALSAALAITPARTAALAVPSAYAAFLLFATLSAAPRLGLGAFAVPAALVTMHGAYGIGWWMGLFKLRLTHADKPHRSLAR